VAGTGSTTTFPRIGWDAIGCSGAGGAGGTTSGRDWLGRIESPCTIANALGERPGIEAGGIDAGAIDAGGIDEGGIDAGAGSKVTGSGVRSVAAGCSAATPTIDLGFSDGGGAAPGPTRNGVGAMGLPLDRGITDEGPFNFGRLDSGNPIQKFLSARTAPWIAPDHEGEG
jgi:hypothetical protein